MWCCKPKIQSFRVRAKFRSSALISSQDGENDTFWNSLLNECHDNKLTIIILDVLDKHQILSV